MKKIFVILALIVLWVMAWMWLRSPAGVRKVDFILNAQDNIYAQARENLKKTDSYALNFKYQEEKCK